MLNRFYDLNMNIYLFSTHVWFTQTIPTKQHENTIMYLPYHYCCTSSSSMSTQSSRLLFWSTGFWTFVAPSSFSGKKRKKWEQKREREIEGGREMETGEVERGTDRDKETDRQTDRQTDWRTDKQVDRERGREILLLIILIVFLKLFPVKFFLNISCWIYIYLNTDRKLQCYLYI